MDGKTKISINLESLLDLSAKLNQTYDEMMIYNASLLSLMGKLKILRGAVFIPEGDKFVVVLKKGKIDLNDCLAFDISEFEKLGSDDKPELCNSGFKYCVPVNYQQELFAVLCLGPCLDGTELNGDEVRYSRMVAMICGNAIQNAHNHQKNVNAKNDLERRNQLLSTLFEMSREFSGLLSRHEILRMLSYRLMGQLMVSRFAVFLRKDSHFDLIVNRFEKQITEEDIEKISGISRTTFLSSLDMGNKAPEIFRELGVNVISPMIVQGQTQGFMIIGKKLNGSKTRTEDLHFIEALGTTAITALENERLFQEELEKKHLESELSVALEIQKNLLPKEIPDFAHCDIYGLSKPSRHVGGDYFDIIELPENRLFLAIADVSGKGMPASLLMANVQAALRSLAPLNLDLKEIVIRLNQIVFMNTSADKFVTFFGAVFDRTTHELSYINAGHNPPILLKDGEISFLTEGGLILGITDTFDSYNQGKTGLGDGDMILMYTDGITEAWDDDQNEFGEDRLVKLLGKLKEQSARAICDSILDSIRGLNTKDVQDDDITLLVIKIKK